MVATGATSVRASRSGTAVRMPSGTVTGSVTGAGYPTTAHPLARTSAEAIATGNIRFRMFHIVHRVAGRFKGEGFQDRRRTAGFLQPMTVVNGLVRPQWRESR